MRNFLNVSAQESKGLHKPIYLNAKKLKSEALLLAENNAYSTASSLTILSTEELIKAILVLLHSEGYKVYRLKEAHMFFKDHTIRHHLAQLIETGIGLFEATETLKNQKTNFTTPKKSIKSIIGMVLNREELLKPISTSINRINNLQNFNSIKNQGLYVDFNNEIKIPENEVIKTDFENTVNIQQRIMVFYKKLCLLFHPKIDLHLSKKKADEYRQNIHLFIDEALADIKFRELKNVK